MNFLKKDVVSMAAYVATFLDFGRQHMWPFLPKQLASDLSDNNTHFHWQFL